MLWTAEAPEPQNLIPYPYSNGKTYTNRSVVFTCDDDKQTVTSSGGSNSSSSSATYNILNAESGTEAPILCKANTTYRLTGTPPESNGTNLRIRVYYKKATQTTAATAFQNESAGLTLKWAEDYLITRIYIMVNSTVTGEHVFTPRLVEVA